MTEQNQELKLYHGEILISYRTKGGVVGNFHERMDDRSHYFVGRNPEEVTAQSSGLLEKFREKYLGEDMCMDQNSNTEDPAVEVNPNLVLREVQAPGYKISLEKITVVVPLTFFDTLGFIKKDSDICKKVN
jgi:hypothetical protein